MPALLPAALKSGTPRHILCCRLQTTGNQEAGPGGLKFNQHRVFQQVSQLVYKVLAICLLDALNLMMPGPLCGL